MSWTEQVSHSKNVWLWGFRAQANQVTNPGMWYVWHNEDNPLPHGFWTFPDAHKFVIDLVDHPEHFDSCKWFIRKAP